MQTTFIRQHFNSIAKQAGVMLCGWLAINSLGSDRTPEGYIGQGFIEGAGYA